MKRAIILILALTLCVGVLFSGCKGKDDAADSSVPSSSVRDSESASDNGGSGLNGGGVGDLTGGVGESATGTSDAHMDTFLDPSNGMVTGG